MDSLKQLNLSLKLCYKCKEKKPFDFFGADKSRGDGKNPVCKVCLKKYLATWKENNKDKRKATVDKYRANNRDKCNEAVKKSNQKHPETQRNWVNKNREKVQQIKRDWAARHSHQNKEIKANNKAKRRGASGNFTKQQIDDLLIKQKHKCACCKTSISNEYHRDHIIPIALNGNNEIYNIQLLCKQCNLSKGAKHPIDFMQTKGFLL
jgi:5-methylcytosine-specific restriction endonuclease McrA